MLPLLIVFTCTSCVHTYYLSRHAEKNEAATGGTTTQATPLSQDGENRANALRDVLSGTKIAYMFSTNTVRTRSTGRPTAIAQNADTLLYNAAPGSDSMQKFIARLQRIKKNVLIIGHSNTVDDIANALSGKQSVPGDLADNQFDNLFVIKYRTFFGTKKIFSVRKYGVLTP